MAELAELRALVDAMGKSLDALTAEVHSIVKHDAQLMGSNGGGEHNALKREVDKLKTDVAVIQTKLPRPWTDMQRYVSGGIMIVLAAMVTGLGAWILHENEHQIVQDSLILNQSAAIKELQDHIDNQFVNHNARMSQEIQGIKPKK